MRTATTEAMLTTSQTIELGLRGGCASQASRSQQGPGEKRAFSDKTHGARGRTKKPGTAPLRMHSPLLHLSVMNVSPKMSLMSWFIAGSSKRDGSPVLVVNLPGPLISSARKSVMSVSD
jgi:hypothetical protein